MTAIMILGLLWALKRGEKHSEDGNKMIAKQNLDGLQFIDAGHPSIRVRQLIQRTPKLRLTSAQYVGRWVSTADGTHKDGSFPGKTANPSAELC